MVTGAIASLGFVIVWVYFLIGSKDPQTPVGWFFTPLYCFIVYFTVCGALASFRSLWLPRELPLHDTEMRSLHALILLIFFLLFVVALFTFVGWAASEILSTFK